MKAGVAERFATETLVILHSVDDDRPSKYVCEDKNVGLFQAGPRLWKKTTINTRHTERESIQNAAPRTDLSCGIAVN